ncbi:MAG: 50S ribosomal protein L9 [bacterium]|nr:50S ribosomal protein L9 [bacterium]
MKVILAKSVSHLGKKGDIIEASDGYARNFLLPKKLAYLSNDPLAKLIIKSGEQILAGERKKQSAIAKIADKLGGQTINFTKKATPKGSLYAQVTSVEVAETIGTQLGITIDAKEIAVANPIKNIGRHRAALRSHFKNVDFFIEIKQQ